jgi:serine protease Do
VRRGHLGIAARDRLLDRRLVRALELPGERGVEVMTVEAGGPAAQSGLRSGDIIIALNEQTVRYVDDLHRLLAELPFGKPLALSVLRGRARKTLEVTPTESSG